MAPVPFLSFIFTGLRWSGHASPTCAFLLRRRRPPRGQIGDRDIYSGARLDREPVEISRPAMPRIIVFIDVSVYIYDGIVGFGVKRPGKIMEHP